MRARVFTATLATLALMTAAAPAQVSRRETTNATTPEADAQPNSADVPDAYATFGQFERVVVLRLKHQTDLLAGIEQMVKQHKIKNAVILAGIGSVRNYHVHSVSNRTFPTKNVYVKDPTAPADLVSMNGYVIDGRVHAHVTLTDGEHAFGGHLEPETNVFTFAIVTLGTLAEPFDLSRADDKTYR
jgi:predicted DNA-binding protein with PD1-like motif